MIKIFDNIDIAIINILLDEQKYTTSQLAKLIFTPKTSIELQNTDIKIRYHLKKLVNIGIIKKTRPLNKAYYFMEIKDVIYGKGYLMVERPKDKKKFKIEFGNLFVIKGEKYSHILCFH